MKSRETLVMFLENVSEIIDFMVRQHVKLHGEKPRVIASAPGRLDFLNTHQDYKGLPVVSVAINRRTYVALSISKNESKTVSINLCEEGVPCEDTFNVDHPDLVDRGWFGNYTRSVVRALRMKGYSFEDFNLTIFSEVPVGSGLASSAALQVSLVAGLNALFKLGLEKKDIAETAYFSEHDIMGIPCGRLDQYGSAMGGITLINTKPPFNTKTFVKKDLLFIVFDSGIRHSTGSIHPVRISELKQGVKELLLMNDLPGDLKNIIKEETYEVEWERLSYQRLEPYLRRINQVSMKRIVFTLKMHLSTILALKLLEESSNTNTWNEVEAFLTMECEECLGKYGVQANNFLRLLGGLVNYQHVLLRDLYEVSLPQLELIRNKALEAGSYGVKISGAGLGGSLLGLVDSREQAVKILEHTRGLVRNAWIVSYDEGVRVDFES